MINPRKILDFAGLLSAHLSPVVKFAVDWKRVGGQWAPNSESEAAGQRSYDIFISYRRDRGSEIARLLAEKLRKLGYRPFLDVDGLNSGEWGVALAERIEECPDFVAIVTDGYFDRCVNEDDVVRREIALALASKRNTIPLFVGTPDLSRELPEEIGGICAHNGIKYLHEYSEQAFEKLCGFLSTPPALGPRRLETGDLMPRLVIFCVFLVIGIWRGALNARDVAWLRWGFQGRSPAYSGGVFSTIWDSLRDGLEKGIAFCLLIILPAILVFSVLAKRSGIPSDSFYGGRWVPFWGANCIILMSLASFSSEITMTALLWSSKFSGILEWLFRSHAFIFGGFVGGATAILWTRLVIRGNFWSKVTKLLQSI